MYKNILIILGMTFSVHLFNFRVYPIPTENYTIKVIYYRLPNSLTRSNIELEVSPVWNFALENFVIGAALFDDNDAANMARGKSFLDIYNRELEQAKRLKSKSFTKRTIETPIRSF